MILRTLLLALLVYILYRLIKGVLFPKHQPRIEGNRSGEATIEDMMVKDEHCGTYIPLAEALVVKWNGKEYYFCTEACLEESKREREASIGGKERTDQSH